MKVFNLACEHEHRFEGWFGSAEDYDAQLARGLVECPICASTAIRKMPSAPRLNLSGASERPEVPATGPSGAGQPPDPRALQAMFMKLARSIVENTEDVGPRFADEARKIHYREAPERGIRGTTSPEQARELAEEGIEVFSLPLPAAAKEPLQ
ncbi:MAG: hypothetical protein RJA99_4786 [Pseudomonadota bacterium]|jgi:hypothetical protein